MEKIFFCAQLGVYYINQNYVEMEVKEANESTGEKINEIVIILLSLMKILSELIGLFRSTKTMLTL
jgi:hypothetical protein